MWGEHIGHSAATQCRYVNEWMYRQANGCCMRVYAGRGETNGRTCSVGRWESREARRLNSARDWDLFGHMILRKLLHLLLFLYYTEKKRKIT